MPRAGDRFRFYPDRTDSATYTEKVMTDETPKTNAPERAHQQQWYRISLSIRNYVA